MKILLFFLLAENALAVCPPPEFSWISFIKRPCFWNCDWHKPPESCHVIELTSIFKITDHTITPAPPNESFFSTVGKLFSSFERFESFVEEAINGLVSYTLKQISSSNYPYLESTVEKDTSEDIEVTRASETSSSTPDPYSTASPEPSTPSTVETTKIQDIEVTRVSETSYFTPDPSSTASPEPSTPSTVETTTIQDIEVTRASETSSSTLDPYSTASPEPSTPSTVETTKIQDIEVTRASETSSFTPDHSSTASPLSSSPSTAAFTTNKNLEFITTASQTSTPETTTTTTTVAPSTLPLSQKVALCGRRLYMAVQKVCGHCKGNSHIDIATICCSLKCDRNDIINACCAD